MNRRKMIQTTTFFDLSYEILKNITIGMQGLYIIEQLIPIVY